MSTATAAITRLPGSTPVPNLAEAVTRFVRRDRFEPKMSAAYRETLDALHAAIGNQPVDRITTDQVETFLENRWATTAPATYNRHRSCLVAFFMYAVKQDWRPDNPATRAEARKARKRSAAARTERAISRENLSALFRLSDINLREKTLWVLAYETWGRTGQELLTLDVEDVDLANLQAVVSGKGGDKELVFFGTHSARLLRRLIGDRKTGHVFLSTRQPNQVAVPAADKAPDGRSRLGYRQAATLFSKAGKRVDPDGPPWTLHRLRHSGIVHSCDGLGPNASWSLPAIMSKTRHQSLRSVERYAYCPAETAAALTADLDPARRKR